MACLKLFFCLFLLTSFLISCSATRLFNPFSVSNPALIQDTKAQNQASSSVKLDMPERHVESMQVKLTLAVEAENMSQTSKASDRNSSIRGGSSSSSSSKRALIEEGREAIEASIQRNDGNPFESTRISPGGPDPHHH